MTNKEIKNLCIEQQNKQGEDYPNWKFQVSQLKNKIKIYWEYIDLNNNPWTIEIIDNDFYYVTNEYDESMIYELEDLTTLESTIKSIVYYMNTRY